VFLAFTMAPAESRNVRNKIFSTVLAVAFMIKILTPPKYIAFQIKLIASFGNHKSEEISYIIGSELMNYHANILPDNMTFRK